MSLLGGHHWLTAFALALLLFPSAAPGHQPEQPEDRQTAGGTPELPREGWTPISFELDIQPILTVTGCNSGPCHGKQRGQNGFQLSLLGFDSDFDHHALVHAARGRRLFPASPQHSLLVKKATAELPHGGGQRLEPGSPMHQKLVDWIAQGAPRRTAAEPTLEQVELTETKFVLQPHETAQLEVWASYSDGSRRQVTELTSYLANEATVVAVADNGGLKAGPLPGETAVMARYMNHICVADVVIPQPSAGQLQDRFDLPQFNFIDQHIDAKLQQLGIEPSQVAPESTLLRRFYLDLIGRLPTPEETRNYLANLPSTDDDNLSQLQAHRAALVDRLLERPEYVDHWANQWADLLRPNPYRVGIKTVLSYDNWIRQQFREDVSYDQFVHRLVTAQGSTWQNGATVLFRDRRSPDEVATLISQLFLGIRLDCAKCHHHPFEKWSQTDFYSFAAYFGQIGYKGTGLSPPISGSEEFVFHAGKGSVSHPVTGEVLKPRPLFGSAPEASPGEDPRRQLADWMTSPENDFFAKVQVNRLWAALMGRGLVDPVDDLRSTNPPTHPELLEALADHFRQVGFDNRQMLRTIALSRAYAASSLPTESNVSDRLNYSRHYRRRLRAEVLLDAVADVTQTPSSFPAMPPQSRAAQVWTHRSSSLFLDTFGRPDENQDPPCERLEDSTVTQALHLMNDAELDRRIRGDQGRAAQLAASPLSPHEIVQQLYLVAYSRYPTPEQAEWAAGRIAAAGEERRRVIEDLMWAMINSPEFTILD
jgi:hypothetical protein